MILRARSVLEEHLYMELHPCACGYGAAPAAHAVRAEGPVLMSVWSGSCERCGRARRFEFVVADGPPPPSGTFGGAHPSQIIRAAEFLRLSDEAARKVPTRGRVSPEALRWLGRAASCLREVIKFFPDGVATVQGIPVSRERLEARLAAYEALLTRG